MDKIVESLIRKDYVEAKSLIENALGKIALNRINEVRMKLGNLIITSNGGKEPPPETPSMGPSMGPFGQEGNKLRKESQKGNDKPNVFDAIETVNQKLFRAHSDEMKGDKGLGSRNVYKKIKELQEKSANAAHEKNGSDTTPIHVHNEAMEDEHYRNAFNRAVQEHGVSPEELAKEYWKHWAGMKDRS